MECSLVRPGPEKGVELAESVQGTVPELAELGGNVQGTVLELAELRGDLRRQHAWHGQQECSRVRPGHARGAELEVEEGSVSTYDVATRVSGATQLYASEWGSTQLYASASDGESTQRHSGASVASGASSQG